MDSASDLTRHQSSPSKWILEARERWSRPLLVFLFALSTSGFTGTAAAAEAWHLEKADQGVKVYLRDYPDSSIPEFKAVTRISASMGSILAVLLDVSAYPEWVHRCREAVSLEVVSNREQYIYQVNTLPFARDRDIILHAELVHRNHGREIIIELEAAPRYCQDNAAAICDSIEAQPYIRIPEMVGSYRMEQLAGGTVEVTWQQFIDPGGKLPAWLIKAMISSVPLKTLSELHEMVERPPYRDSELVLQDGSLRVISR